MWVTTVFFPEGDARLRNLVGQKPRERSHTLAELDLSIQSPHRRTLGIPHVLRLTPRRSFREFDGMHAIKNILAAIFSALRGQSIKPPRRAVGNSPDEVAEYAERHAAWTEDTQRAEYWRLTEAQQMEFDRRYDSIPAPTTVKCRGYTGLATRVFHLLFEARGIPAQYLTPTFFLLGEGIGYPSQLERCFFFTYIFFCSSELCAPQWISFWMYVWLPDNL